MCRGVPDYSSASLAKADGHTERTRLCVNGSGPGQGQPGTKLAVHFSSRDALLDRADS